MLKSIPFQADADHVVALELDGKIERHDIENTIALVEDKLERHNKLRIYVEIKSIGGVSPRALLLDLKAAVKHWKRLDKEAIVTDNTAIEKTIPLLDTVLPGIELKVFSFNKREYAHQWIIG